MEMSCQHMPPPLWTFLRRERSPAIAVIQTPDHPAHILDTVPTISISIGNWLEALAVSTFGISQNNVLGRYFARYMGCPGIGICIAR
jgi:hypothetical protein